MSASPFNCPFCASLIQIEEGKSLKECPSCLQALHRPVKSTKETASYSLQDPHPTYSAKEPSNHSESLPQNNGPRLLGPYRIIRNVGKGGMGFVYEALDTRLGRTVALKTIEKNEGYNEQLIQRFQQEAKNSARLRHPHIVSVHDVGSDHGFDYFTMDLVEGVTLDRWVQSTSPSVRTRISIVEKVARALHYAHKQGVIHRDVKPSNIMVDATGEPQIMDFGLARNTRDTRNLTLAGSVMGTPAYMSPEQAMGPSTEVGAATDVWALGILMYEILTGKLPFDAGNIYQTIYAVLHSEPGSPSKLNNEISRDLSTIILKCLEKSVPKRYPNAEILANDLKAYLEDRPISARQLTWWEKMLKKLNRTRAISIDEFIMEQQARQRAEAQELELKTKVESESRKEWRVIFEDDFSDPDLASRWECYGGNVEIANGELHLWGGEPQIMYLKQSVTGDIRIEFECHQESDFLTDISCFMTALPLHDRKRACDSGYMFQFGAVSNTKSFIERPKCRLWEHEENPLKRGMKYRIRAEKIGAKLSWWVNEVLLCEIEDSDPLMGSERNSIGIYGWLSDSYYRYFKVSKLSTSLKEDILELGQRQLEKGKDEVAIQLFEEVLETGGDPIRQEQAKKGIQFARRKLQIQRDFAIYAKKIEATLPGAELEMDIEGLRLSMRRLSVSDLTCIKGIPLTSLSCRENHIKSLEPLREMTSLLKLDAQYNEIFDLEPIKDLHLENLIVSQNPLRNLEALRNSTLKSLHCSFTGVNDLNPLAGSHLFWLFAENNEISDLSPLEGTALKELDVGCNSIRDLTPLKNLSLNNLACPLNQITSLEPLATLPLQVLHCWGNPLADLGPFLKNPPRSFYFDTETLSDSELERSLSIWKAKQLTKNAREVETLIRLRQKDSTGLRKLAIPFGNNLYLFIPKFLPWENAQKLALEVSASLLTFESYEERQFIKSAQFSSFPVWLGLVMKNGKKEWVNGESYDSGKIQFSEDQIKESFHSDPSQKTFYGITSSGGISFPGNKFPRASIFKWRVP